MITIPHHCGVQASALPWGLWRALMGKGQNELELERPIQWCLPVYSAAMEELDGDDVRVSSRGRYAERDIVQVALGVVKAKRNKGKERLPSSHSPYSFLVTSCLPSLFKTFLTQKASSFFCLLLFYLQDKILLDSTSCSGTPDPPSSASRVLQHHTRFWTVLLVWIKQVVGTGGTGGPSLCPLAEMTSITQTDQEANAAVVSNSCQERFLWGCDVDTEVKPEEGISFTGREGACKTCQRLRPG